MASHDDDPRELILAYRAQHGPPLRAAAHNWQQLVRRIDAGEPAPALSDVDDDEPPRPLAHPRSRAWAFGLAAAAAALLAARFVWPERFAARGPDVGAAAPYHHDAEARPQAVQVPPPRAPAARPSPVSSDTSPLEPTITAPPVPPDGAPAAVPPPPVRPVSPSMPDQTAREADLARELAAVRAAAQAVRDGDGAAALRLVDDYLAAHPRGALVPEARLRRVEALCLLARRDEARREVGAFVGDYPHSPLRERVESACK